MPGHSVRSRALYRSCSPAVEPISPRYNIAPGDDLDIIPNDDTDRIDRFQWGLIPHWIDDPDDWPKPINARAETVAEKPSFQGAFSERRCLILADGFYEWKGERGSKQPYRIKRVDDEPFVFAGLWESWGSNGDNLQTATIITTAANETVAPIHDRMPVMLEPDDENLWLESDDEGILNSILDSYPDELLDTYSISKKVNDHMNDSPDVIESIDIGGQSGLEEFG